MWNMLGLGEYPRFVIEPLGLETAMVWQYTDMQYGSALVKLVVSGELAMLSGRRLANAVLPMHLILTTVSCNLEVAKCS